jgi:hypothetical protein
MQNNDLNRATADALDAAPQKFDKDHGREKKKKDVFSRHCAAKENRFLAKIALLDACAVRHQHYASVEAYGGVATTVVRIGCPGCRVLATL